MRGSFFQKKTPALLRKTRRRHRQVWDQEGPKPEGVPGTKSSAARSDAYPQAGGRAGGREGQANKASGNRRHYAQRGPATTRPALEPRAGLPQKKHDRPIRQTVAKKYANPSAPDRGGSKKPQKASDEGRVGPGPEGHGPGPTPGAPAPRAERSPAEPTRATCTHILPDLCRDSRPRGAAHIQNT